MSFEILPPDNGQWRAGPTSGGASGRPDDLFVEVGEFQQGSESSRWALSRYLVGRVIGEYVAGYLLAGVLIMFALAVAVWVFGTQWLAVIIALVALGGLMMRWLFGLILRRVSGAAFPAPVEHRLHQVVKQARRSVRAELHRIGLPSHLLTMPLLVVRLYRRRTRAATVERLQQFDVARAVSPAQLDELHLSLAQLQTGPS